MKSDEIKKVLIVGAGTMGQQIGTQCAVHGCEVVFYDIRQEILANALQRVEKLITYFVKTSKITQGEARATAARMTATTDLSLAAADADLVSESAPEDPEVKGIIFSRIHPLCPEHTIFTTNTSTLLPSAFADKTGRPEKFLAFHFHDVRVTDIVDIMAHAGTSEETVALVREFAIKIGQIPIVLKKENSGYVFNHMLTTLFQAAQTLAANSVTSIEEIDRAWMGVTRMTMGPFGLMDSVGIDTVWKVTDYWAAKNNNAQDRKNADFLKTYVDKGLLGQKSGRGFYTYPNPAYARPGFIKGE